MWRLLLAFQLALFSLLVHAGYLNKQYNYQPNNSPYGYQPVKGHGKPKDCYDNNDYHPKGYGSGKQLNKYNYPSKGPAYNTYGYEQPNQNNYEYAREGGYEGRTGYAHNSGGQDYAINHEQPHGYEQPPQVNYGYQQLASKNYEPVKQEPVYEHHYFGPTKVTVQDSFPVNYVGAKTDYEVDLIDVILPLPGHKHKKRRYQEVPVQKNYVDYKHSKEVHTNYYNAPNQQDYYKDVSPEAAYDHQEAGVPYLSDQKQGYGQETYGGVPYQEEHNSGYIPENNKEEEHGHQIEIPSNYEKPGQSYSPPQLAEHYGKEVEQKPDYNQPSKPTQYSSKEKEPTYSEPAPEPSDYNNEPKEQSVEGQPSQSSPFPPSPSPITSPATQTPTMTTTTAETPLSSNNNDIINENIQQQPQQNPDLLDEEEEQQEQNLQKPTIQEAVALGPDGVVQCEEKITIEKCSAFFTCKHAGGGSIIGSCWQKGVDQVFDGTTQSCLKSEALKECGRDSFCEGEAQGWKLMDAKKCTKKAFFCDNEAEDHICDQTMVIDPTDPSSCVRENTVPDCTPFLLQARATD